MPVRASTADCRARPTGLFMISRTAAHTAIRRPTTMVAVEKSPVTTQVCQGGSGSGSCVVGSQRERRQARPTQLDALRLHRHWHHRIAGDCVRATEWASRAHRSGDPWSFRRRHHRRREAAARAPVWLVRELRCAFPRE